MLMFNGLPPEKLSYHEGDIDQDAPVDLRKMEIPCRIRGGSRGSSEPPLAGESFCTTTPPVDKHQNELFSCIGHQLQFAIVSTSIVSPGPE